MKHHLQLSVVNDTIKGAVPMENDGCYISAGQVQQYPIYSESRPSVQTTEPRAGEQHPPLA